MIDEFINNLNFKIYYFFNHLDPLITSIEKLGSSTWATFDVFSSYSAHKSVKSAYSKTV